MTTDFENLRAHAQRGDYTNAQLARRVQDLESALDKAADQLIAAQDDAARLRAAIEQVTWEHNCPWCGESHGNHAPDCVRQAALAQTSEVKA